MKEGVSPRADAATATLLGFGAAIVSAELAGMLGGLWVGTLVYAMLVPFLVRHFVVLNDAVHRCIVVVLALIALQRIAGAIMPLPQIPHIYWYALIAMPLLLAIGLALRLLHYTPTHIGLGRTDWRLQLVIGFAGLPLGIAAYLLFRPIGFLTLVDFTFRDFVIGAMILLVCTALTEEVIFRGLLFPAAQELWGRGGTLYATALFATLYLGTLNTGYVLFMTLVGLFFSWCVKQSDSIWGVVLAHGLLNIGLLLVWPLVWP